MTKKRRDELLRDLVDKLNEDPSVIAANKTLIESLKRIEDNIKRMQDINLNNFIAYIPEVEWNLN